MRNNVAATLRRLRSKSRAGQRPRDQYVNARPKTIEGEREAKQPRQFLRSVHASVLPINMLLTTTTTPLRTVFFFVSLLSYFSLWWFSLHFHARFDRFVAVVSIIFVRVFLGGGGDFPPSCCQLFYYRVPGMHCCFYSCYTVSQDHRQLLHLPGTLFACLLVFLFFCLFFFVIARRR